jgi:hypothetical protein
MRNENIACFLLINREYFREIGIFVLKTEKNIKKKYTKNGLILSVGLPIAFYWPCLPGAVPGYYYPNLTTPSD